LRNLRSRKLPTGIYFEVEGDVQLARSLSRFGNSVKDYRPAFRDIIKLFYEMEKKQFESEGGYGSGGWAPLSADYDEWKAKNFPGKPILQLTGKLMSALTNKTGETIQEIEPLLLKLGTNLKYGLFHQTGTKKMPARKPIEMTEHDKREWVKVIQKYLVTETRKAGLA